MNDEFDNKREAEIAKILAEIPSGSILREMGRRNRCDTFHTKIDCMNVNAIIDLSWGIQDETSEYLYIIYLTAHGTFICMEKQTASNPTEMSIGIRHIVKQALKHSASGVILVHNHPFVHDAIPSQADIDVTCRVYETMNNLSMTLADHVIFSDGGYFSMRETGVLESIRKIVKENNVCSKSIIKAEGESNESGCE